MKAATLAILCGMTAALGGCGRGDAPGSTVDFIASNPDSVLLDFGAIPPGEMTYANETAAQQCGIFHRNAAVLESLNTRSDGRIRATYVCKR